jgi:hypothetical protein
MKMAKASEKDIDAAGDAMSVLNDISSGYYPKRDGDECEDLRFDPEDPAHLRKFYDLMSATIDASPGWPGRVIGGMCYVLLFDANKIVDPDSDCLELHPRLAAAPELLAVLQTIVRVADGRTVPGNLILDENSPLMDAARDAISKALGEQQ